MAMEMYKNKYRTTSTRLKKWDYSQCGWYFNTVCTKNKEHFFGAGIKEKMKLSAIGEIVKKEWIKDPIIRLDMNSTLDEFIIIPNHFHTIIIIGKNIHNTTVETQCFASDSNQSEINKKTHPVDSLYMDVSFLDLTFNFIKYKYRHFIYGFKYKSDVRN